MTRTRSRGNPQLGMILGYARVSTVEQQAGFEDQLRTLERAGCAKVFQERVSSVGVRPQLDACLEYVRSGDALVVAASIGWPAPPPTCYRSSRPWSARGAPSAFSICRSTRRPPPAASCSL
jgi:Resolvase, N terminal domain